MSGENVKIVKRAIDAFNRRDIEAIYECVNSDLSRWIAAPHAGREGDRSQRTAFEPGYLVSAIALDGGCCVDA
jgi:hypothetical protein